MSKTNIPTPHISAAYGDFADKVLMPGDPLRAKFIADQFLDDARQITGVRNMLGYTGYYKGSPVSVMGHGMGSPSVGIYSHELFHFYDVEKIIRIGSAGSISMNCRLRDLVAAQGACTDSGWAAQYHMRGTFAPIGDFGLLKRAYDLSEEKGIHLNVGNVLTSDVFYDDDPDVNKPWMKMGVLCVEMETAALYMEAARAGKKALALLTISDHILTGERLTAAERETGLVQMIELALDI